MNKYDVVAIGELLIDYTEYGISGQGNPVWEANPGGGTCNILSMASRLGKKTAFIGKVGKDVYGRQLEQALRESGIDTAGLVFDDKVHTTLAIVAKLPNGDRDFSFYRDPGADMMLRADEVDPDLLLCTRFLHFGTLSMTHENVREATKKAVATAKGGRALISFDPNLRFPLWKDPEDARVQMEWALGQCDVLKISDNEVEFYTGGSDLEHGAETIMQRHPGIRMLNLTMGSGGSTCFYSGRRVFVPAFPNSGTVDTTGAGDTFGGCILAFLCDNGLDRLTDRQIREMLTFANAAASIVTARKGALRVMPAKLEIEALLASGRVLFDN